MFTNSDSQSSPWQIVVLWLVCVYTARVVTYTPFYFFVFFSRQWQAKEDEKKWYPVHNVSVAKQKNICLPHLLQHFVPRNLLDGR